MTIRLIALVLALTFTAAPSHAQVVSVDLQAAGLPDAYYAAVETDGNLATQEWLVHQPFTTWRMIVRVSSDGAVCAGAWFSVDSTWVLQRVGLKHEFTRTAWPRFERLPLSAHAPAGCAW